MPEKTSIKSLEFQFIEATLLPALIDLGGLPSYLKEKVENSNEYKLLVSLHKIMKSGSALGLTNEKFKSIQEKIYIILQILIEDMFRDLVSGHANSYGGDLTIAQGSKKGLSVKEVKAQNISYFQIISNYLPVWLKDNGFKSQFLLKIAESSETLLIVRRFKNQVEESSEVFHNQGWKMEKRGGSVLDYFVTDAEGNSYNIASLFFLNPKTRIEADRLCRNDIRDYGLDGDASLTGTEG